jgi:glutamate-1-semialdehyde 2,1-aminomutase
MQQLAPEGPVYQAGTLSGSPLAVAAGLAALSQLEGEEPYQRLEWLGQRLERGLLSEAERRGVPVQVNRVGSMLTFFLNSDPVTDYASAASGDAGRFAAIHYALLSEGVFWPPSQFESSFLSMVHTDDLVDQVVAAFGAAL